MNLKLILPLKKIVINEKEISIPKLGLKHQKMIKDEKDPLIVISKILKSIHPNLTAAESDLATIHLLEFNDKIKSSVIKDGFKYDINDVYICQRLIFHFGGKEYKFRSHDPYEQFGPVDAVLSSLYLGSDVPDFLDMPAFVSKWADDITSTIAIPGPSGPIKGILAIMDILNAE